MDKVIQPSGVQPQLPLSEEQLQAELLGAFVEKALTEEEALASQQAQPVGAAEEGQ